MVRLDHKKDYNGVLFLYLNGHISRRKKLGISNGLKNDANTIDVIGVPEKLQKIKVAGFLYLNKNK